jgi:hypothetical protein
MMGKYDLDFKGKNFVLVSKQTDYLASYSCGIHQDKLKVSLAEMISKNSCKLGGGCC